MAAQNGGSSIQRVQPGGFLPLSQAVDQLFRESFLFPRGWNEGYGSGFAAPLGSNLWESNDHYTAQFAMPGVKPDSIAVTVDHGVLIVQGEPAVAAPEGAKALWQGLTGQTQYRVSLPAQVDADQAQANYEHGILTISLPKAAAARTRTIKVNAR